MNPLPIDSSWFETPESRQELWEMVRLVVDSDEKFRAWYRQRTQHASDE